MVPPQRPIVKGHSSKGSDATTAPPHQWAIIKGHSSKGNNAAMAPSQRALKQHCHRLEEAHPHPFAQPPRHIHSVHIRVDAHASRFWQVCRQPVFNLHCMCTRMCKEHA
eukprot:1146329-Pelagomonas_calceolata.AAC.3